VNVGMRNKGTSKVSQDCEEDATLN
jgi:hypothetical protein